MTEEKLPKELPELPLLTDRRISELWDKELPSMFNNEVDSPMLELITFGKAVAKAERDLCLTQPLPIPNETIVFGQRIAKAMDEVRSSHVFFILQQAFPEDADELAWNDFQAKITRVLQERDLCLETLRKAGYEEKK